MSQALSYALPGIPYGCTFALVAIGLVLSYQSTGVFNFAFGAQAYVAAVAYAQLASHGVPRALSGVLAILVLSPLLGVLIDRLIFSRIPTGNVAAKTIAALGLMVGLPALVTILVGPGDISSPPSLLFDVNTVIFHVAGTPVDGVQLSTVVVTILVLIALTTTLRHSVFGLEMRAAVESPRLLRLHGVSSRRVTTLAWATSSTLAGLAGVLLAPRYATVSIDNYTVLLVAAIAGAAIAGLESPVIAAVASVGIGVAMGLTTGYAPAGSVWSTGLLSAIPFVLLLGLLAFHPKLRRLGSSEDPLASVDPPPTPILPPERSVMLTSSLRYIGPAVLVLMVISMLTWVSSTWVFVITGGLGLSLVFMSITLTTGAAGQVSLCQATFAGVGAFTAGQLATHQGVAVTGFFVRRLLRGTTGRGLAASRQSPLAAAGIGFSPSLTRMVVFALSAAIAGVGGAMYGSLLQVVSPGDFTYVDSLLFVVIVVTVGARTVAGAIEAGVAFAVLTQLLSFLPNRASPSSIVALLFAIGSFTYASHPEGVVERIRRSASSAVDRVLTATGVSASHHSIEEAVR